MVLGLAKENLPGKGPSSENPPRMFSLEYLAHACFLFDFGATRILIDPFDPVIGYKMPERRCNYVLVSHDHFDHNYTAGVSGRTHILRGCAPRRLGSVEVYGVLADHDDCGGHDKGHVTLFCLHTQDGVRLCHLSDLNHPLTAEQSAEIGSCDLLFLPVGGGGNCLDAHQSVGVARQLGARLIFPMHYRTPFLNRELFPTTQDLKPFLQAAGEHFEVDRQNQSSFRFTGFPQRPTVVLLPHFC